MGFGERKGWLEKLAEKNPAVVAGLPQPPRQPNAAKKEKAPKAARLLSDGPPRAKPQQHESDQQKVCVDWFRSAYPKLVNLLYAIPNGGHRHKAVAARLQAEGVVRGVPDLKLAVCRGGFAGLYLENKYGDNDTSPNQDAVAADLVAEGYQVVVFWTADQFRDIVVDYLAQPRTLLGLLENS